jgi:HD-GYP domain-containing protein (c-di-GMP phosphodiesterase class II)
MSGYRTHSILTIPLATHRGDIIGVLQLINAKGDDGGIVPFDPAIEPYVAYFASNAAAALERAHLMRTVILRMIGMAELRDPHETGSHVNRVAGFAVAMYETWARENGVPEADIERTRDVLRMAAMLHDVGKVAISDVILKKPARLDPAEYEIMKHHTVAGARLFGDMTSEFDEAARDVALNHHERWDGSGYPGHVNAETGEALPGQADSNGKPVPKKGNEIPLFGRIVTIADVYDALSSARSYKEAWTEDRVLAEIRSQQGGAFDPEIVDAFFECLPALRALAERYR